MLQQASRQTFPVRWSHEHNVVTAAGSVESFDIDQRSKPAQHILFASILVSGNSNPTGDEDTSRHIRIPSLCSSARFYHRLCMRTSQHTEETCRCACRSVITSNHRNAFALQALTPSLAGQVQIHTARRACAVPVNDFC